jgi:2-oxoglutarate dehydrogenase E2 component (dihydrolipoamide succinyltransferase)
MTNMRKIIAQRMIESRRTSAHVHCMYEVDFTRIVNLRNKHKVGFEQRHGPTHLHAVLRARRRFALQQWPIINASLEGDNIRYHRHITGHRCRSTGDSSSRPNAGDLNFSAAARHLRPAARPHQKLKPRTSKAHFTVNNSGQLARSSVCRSSTSRTVIMVLAESPNNPWSSPIKMVPTRIAIRSSLLTLGYDHRLIDGAVAKFMDLRKRLCRPERRVGRGGIPDEDAGGLSSRRSLRKGGDCVATG